MQIARLSRFNVNEKRCIGFALVLVPWPRQADSAENPIVKTKLRGLALLRIFLVTEKLQEHKAAGQRA
jgi:hypothetical protein